MEPSVPIRSDPRSGRTIRSDRHRSVRRASPSKAAGRVFLDPASFEHLATCTSTPAGRTHGRHATPDSACSCWPMSGRLGSTWGWKVHVPYLSPHPTNGFEPGRSWVDRGGSLSTRIGGNRKRPGGSDLVRKQQRFPEVEWTQLHVQPSEAMDRNSQGRRPRPVDPQSCGSEPPLCRERVPRGLHRMVEESKPRTGSPCVGHVVSASKEDAIRDSERNRRRESRKSSTGLVQPFIATLRLGDASLPPTSTASLPEPQATWHEDAIPSRRSFQAEASLPFH